MLVLLCFYCYLTVLSLGDSKKCLTLTSLTLPMIILYMSRHMFSRFLLESTQVNSMKQNVELQQTLDSSNIGFYVAQFCV